jgi:hypothetical protein
LIAFIAITYCSYIVASKFELPIYERPKGITEDDYFGNLALARWTLAILRCYLCLKGTTLPVADDHSAGRLLVFGQFLVDGCPLRRQNPDVETD